jgi:hypothetical protein
MIRDIVFSNLNCANENGYFEKDEHLFGATPEDIAEDMISYAADCENYTVEQLLPHVKEWLEVRAAIAVAFHTSKL